MIDFYQSFKNPISAEETEQLKSKIEKRFGSSSSTIKLLPTWISTLTEETGLRLVAASTTLEKKSNSVSYADPEQKFLIRILQTEEKRLLYFLSNVPIPPNTKIKLILHPANISYTLADVNEAMEIVSEAEIDYIDLSVMT